MKFRQFTAKAFVVLIALFVLVAPAWAAQCSDVFSSADGMNSDLQTSGNTLDLSGVPWTNNSWPSSGTTLSSGDYYYGTANLGNGYQLSIADGARVRIFINGSQSFANNIEINTNGEPEQFLLVTNGSLSLGNNPVINGQLYTTGALSVGNNAVISGGLAAEGSIGIGNTDPTVDYSGVDTGLLNGLCDGVLPVFDNFESYQPGTIEGENGGSNWGGAWSGTNDQTIIDTSDNPLEFLDSQNRRIRSATMLEITGNNNEAATRSLDGTFSGDSVFLSALVRFTGDPTNNDFVGFWINESGFGSSPQFGLKVNEGSGGTEDFFVRLDQNADYSTDIEVGETYLLVAQYSKGSEDYFSNAKLWVNPECGTSAPSAPSAEDSGFLASNRISEFSQFGIRSATLGNGDAFQIGQVAIGTQWTDVVRCSPGPLVEYRMEQAAFDGTPGEVVDSTNNNRNATSVGGTQTLIDNPAIAGNPGTCRYADFEGSNDRIVDEDAGDYLNGLEAVTVMAWVYNGAGFDNNDRGIFFTGDSTNGRDNRFGLRYDTDGYFGGGDNVIKASVYTSDCNNPAAECWQVETASNVMTEDAWQHVAMTWTTSGEIKVYVDGSEVGTSGTQGNGGTGQLAQVDRLEIGQGAKGQRWQGNIDEFRIFGIALTEAEIMAEMNRAFPCDGYGPSHIRLNHPSTGLTCTPAQGITVEACANSDDNCSEKYAEEITVELEPASGWNPAQPVTFTGASEGLSLRTTTEGTVTLGVEDVSVDTTSDPGYRCYADGSNVESNCEIFFAESGFLFDIPDHISGEEQTISIQAVKDDETDRAQCVPAFEGEKDVEFDTVYQNPATGTLAVTSGLTDLTGNNLTLDFDDTATATFPLQYSDVGNVLLKARYEGAGDEQDLVMTGQDDFVARPHHFELQASVVETGGNRKMNPQATGRGGDVFTTAGSDFDIQVKAVNASGGATPNFGLESPDTEGVKLEATRFAPVPGKDGIFSGSFDPFGIDCDGGSNGGFACGTFSWSEVGILSLTPSLDGDEVYLSTENVEGVRLDHVGRFIPHRFLVAVANHGAMKPVCEGNNAYFAMGRPVGWRSGLAPELSVTAVSEGGTATENYTANDGEFQYLEAGDVERNYAVSDNVAEDENGNPFPVGSEFSGGTLDREGGGVMNYTFASSDTITYLKKESAPSDQALPVRVLPFVPDYSVTISEVTDSDEVSSPETPLPVEPDFGSGEMRYVRLVLENAYGPETSGLEMPFQAEYFTSEGFVRNSDASCWSYDTSAVSLDQTGLSNGSTSVTEVSDTLDEGRSPAGSGVLLDAPGEDNRGDVIATFAVPVWLQDDFDEDGVLEDPSGLATFGVYRGNDRIIYWQEVLN
jgi:MSHA biogenesis protein MshQ